MFPTESVYQADNDESSVHFIPVVREVALISQEETKSHRLSTLTSDIPLSQHSIIRHLHRHLKCEDESEEVVTDTQYLSLRGPGRDGGSLHR